MAGMRDKLAHDYFGVDLDLVWDVGAAELSAARNRIVVLLGELDDGSISG
jgi:uncharacterized protein with HEPN domain